MLAYYLGPSTIDTAVAYDTFTYVRMARGLLVPHEPIGFHYLGAAEAAHRLQTTFPLGFPTCIALLSALSVPPFVAAAVVPFIALVVASMALQGLLADRLPRTASLVVALFAVSTPVLYAARSALSEMPAVAVLLTSAWLLRRASHSTGRGGPFLGAAAGLVASGVLWFRYGMLAVVPAYAIGLALGLRKERRATLLATAGALASGVAALLLVNAIFGGSAFGPYRPPAPTGFVEQAAKLVNHLVAVTFGWLGERSSPKRLAVSLALLCVLVGVTLVSVVRALRRGDAAERVLGAFLVLYPISILVAEWRVHIDAIDLRLLAPYVPAFVVVVIAPAWGSVLDGSTRASVRLASLALVVAYAAGQIKPGLRREPWPWPGPVRSVRGFEAPSPERRHVLSIVGSGALVTNDKVLLGYLLGPRAAYAGDDRHWIPSRLTRDDLVASPALTDPLYVYLRYDHVGFDPELVGALAAELWRGAARDFTPVSDDGKGLLFLRNAGAPGPS